MPNRTDRYFAAASASDIGDSLINRIVQEIEAKNTMANIYATAYQHYYGHEMGRGVTSSIMRGGSQEELAVIRINRARGLGKSLHSLITGPQVSWRPQAAANDNGAKAANILALNIMEWMWEKRAMSQVAAVQGEQGIIFSEGFVFSPWEEQSGPVRAVDPTTKREIREGDIALYNILPWDIVRDGQAKAYNQLKWKFVRLWVSKWDLIAMREKDILGMPTRENILAASKDEGATSATPRLTDANRDSDLVPLWFFFHEPTPALPAGREVVLVSPRCVLRDRSLSYTRTPLTRFGIDELLGTPYGYSSHWDTLAMQELTDSLESAIASNQLTFAVQSVAVEQGTSSPVTNAFGLKEYEYPKGGKPPTALQLTSSPPEVFNYIKDKARDQMQMLNLNDVQRGQPDTAQMNAQAFMVLASKAVEQNAPGQKGWLGAISDLGTNILQTFCQRVTVERKLQITGKNSKYLYTEQNFKGDQLKPVESVLVKIGNPLEQSAGGRYQLAQLHHDMGLIKDVDDLQQVLDTGRLDPAIQDVRDENMHIASENEDLSNGIVPMVHGFHNHLRHCAKHGAVLSNPQSMRDAKTIKATEAHIHKHYVEFFMLQSPPPDPMMPLPPGALPPEPDPLADPQYPIRIRMLLGQPPPPDMVPMPPPGGATDGTSPPAPGATDMTMAPPGPPDMTAQPPMPGAGQPGPVPPPPGAPPAGPLPI